MAKIILTHEVSGLGSAGDVVDVKNGYARNFLFPRGFATPWSRGAEKQIESIKKARAARDLASLEDAQALAAKLTSTTLTVPVKSGAEGRLFGTVRVKTLRRPLRLRVWAPSTSVVSSSPSASRPPACTRPWFVCTKRSTRTLSSRLSPPDFIPWAPSRVSLECH